MSNAWCVQEMMTSPVALARLGWFLMEARQHQSTRHKDVVMISPPNQGGWNVPPQPPPSPSPPLVSLSSPTSLVLALVKLDFTMSSSQIELTGIVFSCFLHDRPTKHLIMSACDRC